MIKKNNQEIFNNIKLMRIKKGLKLLTLREKEILPMLIRQMTSKEIADKLGISPNTVNIHRQNILDKLEVPNTGCLFFLDLNEEIK